MSSEWSYTRLTGPKGDAGSGFKVEFSALPMPENGDLEVDDGTSTSFLELSDGTNLFIEAGNDSSEGKGWHYPFTDGDLYMRTWSDLDKRWSMGTRIVGEDGEPAVTYEIDEPIVFKQGDTATFRFYRVIEGKRYEARVYYAVATSDDGITYGTEIFGTGTSYTTAALNTAVSVRCRIYASLEAYTAGESYLDEEFIELVNDGISVHLGNENITLACDSSGKLKTAFSTNITVSTLMGTSRVASVITAGSQSTGITIGTITNGTVSVDGIIPLSMSANGTPVAGKLIFTIVAGGATFTKEVNVAVTKDGQQGVPGEPGIPGAPGKGISYETAYYALSTTATRPAQSSFSTTIPTLTSTNKYMWKYVITTYTDSSTSGGYNYAYIAATYGDKGASAETYQYVQDASGGTSDGIYLYGLNDNNEFSMTGQPYFYFNKSKYTPTRDSNSACSGKRRIDIRCRTYVAYLYDSSTYLEWKSTRSYQIGDVVEYQNCKYLCVRATSSTAPSLSNSAWVPANIVECYLNFAENEIYSTITNTKFYDYSSAGTRQVSTIQKIFLGMGDGGANSKWTTNITPVDTLTNEIGFTFLGIVGSVSRSSCSKNYIVKAGNTTFTKIDDGSLDAYPGSIVFNRGIASGYESDVSHDTVKELQVYDGFTWETVSETVNQKILHNCQDQTFIVLAACAKVYKSNNVSVPASCGTVIDLLISNIAIIEKLFAQHIIMTQDSNGSGGYIRSKDFNGTINESTGEISSGGTKKGWAIDYYGNAFFYDVYIQGRMRLKTYTNQTKPLDLEEGDMFLLS